MKIKLYMCGGETPVSEYPLGLGYLKSNCTGADIEIVSDQKDLVDCDLSQIKISHRGQCLSCGCSFLIFQDR